MKYACVYIKETHTKKNISVVSVVFVRPHKNRIEKDVLKKNMFFLFSNQNSSRILRPNHPIPSTKSCFPGLFRPPPPQKKKKNDESSGKKINKNLAILR